MPHEQSISIYLQDHLAGASTGVDVAEQAAARHRDDEMGEFFAPLAEQIKADYALLQSLVHGVTAPPEDPGSSPAAEEMLSLHIDLPGLASRFGHRLHDAGMPVTVTQVELFVRSLQLMQPTTRRELYFATCAIFVTDPDDMPTFDRVFAEVFGNDEVAASQQASADAVEDVIAMNVQRQTYRRRGWPARSASTWVEGDPDRRSVPRAADAEVNPHLHDILLLETLSAEIEGKLSMWTALHNVTGAHPALAAVDFDALEARAKAQRALVEQMIREIAPRALTHALAGV